MITWIINEERKGFNNISIPLPLPLPPWLPVCLSAGLKLGVSLPASSVCGAADSSEVDKYLWVTEGERHGARISNYSARQHRWTRLMFLQSSPSSLIKASPKSSLVHLPAISCFKFPLLLHTHLNTLPHQRPSRPYPLRLLTRKLIKTHTPAWRKKKKKQFLNSSKTLNLTGCHLPKQ